MNGSSFRRLSSAGGNTYSRLTMKVGSLTPYLDSLPKIAHYDVSKIESLFQGEAGSPVTADGQTVGRISDLSGNGHHLTSNGSATRRPTYRAASIDTSGKPVLEFITDDVLAKRLLTIPYTDVCLITVGCVRNSNNWSGLTNIQLDSSSALDMYPCNTLPNTFFIGFARQATAFDDFHVRSGYSVTNNTDRRWRKNGVQQLGGGDGSKYTATNITQISIGSRDWASGQVSSGFVSEYIVMKVADLPYANLGIIEAELKAKWGIA